MVPGENYESAKFEIHQNAKGEAQVKVSMQRDGRTVDFHALAQQTYEIYTAMLSMVNSGDANGNL